MKLVACPSCRELFELAGAHDNLPVHGRTANGYCPGCGCIGLLFGESPRAWAAVPVGEPLSTKHEPTVREAA
jgi:hypothetical protein